MGFEWLKLVPTWVTHVLLCLSWTSTYGHISMITAFSSHYRKSWVSWQTEIFVIPTSLYDITAILECRMITKHQVWCAAAMIMILVWIGYENHDLTIWAGLHRTWIYEYFDAGFGFRRENCNSFQVSSDFWLDLLNYRIRFIIEY